MTDSETSDSALGGDSGARQGAVAVICRDQQFLVIRRSQRVRAPLAFCFPGGGLEAGETDRDALLREIREEIGATIDPVRRLWRSVSHRGVELFWWLAKLPGDAPLSPCPEEVHSIHWLTIDQMRDLDGLLRSNHAFLDALEQGEFVLE